MSRVRMPHNNRVSASAALRTNDMWSRTIGHDPYAADSEKGKQQDQDNSDQAASLMLLAKMSNLSGVESRGGCKKCGMLGHMTFQCRNASGPVVENNDDSSSSSSSDDDDDAPPRSSARPAQDLPQIPVSVDSGKKRAYSDSDSESDRSERKSSKKHKKSSKDSSDKKSKKDKKDRKEKKERKHKSDKDKKDKHKKSKKSSRSSP